jgi:phenylacetate-CoA ligase
MTFLATMVRVLAFRWRFRRWSRERLRRWQTRRAADLARWAAARLPYYRDLWQGRDPGDVWELPTTRKRDLMANFAGANVLGATWEEVTRFREEIDATRDYHRLFRGEYNVELSSGTGGAKGIYLFSPRERSIYAAMIAARNGVPRSVRPLRVVLILRVDSPSLRGINTAGIRLSYLSLATPIPEMVRALNEDGPNVLAGQPWVLRELAREQRAGRLHLRLGALVPIAEVLEPDVREEIAGIFAAPIREIYQASEGIIASSCEQGRLHLNEDFVAVQLSDAAGRPVEGDAVASRMVVTDLYRRTQPILRFELNDLVELDPAPCPCGSCFRVVRRVHGRADDLLWARDAAGQPRSIFPDYFRRFIVRATDAVEEYQVTQTAPDRLRVRLQLRAGADPGAAATAVRDNLRRLYADHGAAAPEIDVEFGAPELHPTSRKLRRIIRACDPPG